MAGFPDEKSAFEKGNHRPLGDNPISGGCYGRKE
jgi:hypothetical protein